MKNILAVMIVLLALSACKKAYEAEAGLTFVAGSVLFSSGFEGDTYLSEPRSNYELEYWSDYDIIRGTDTTTGYSWPIQLLGSDFSGIHRINDDDGFAVENRIESVIGPSGEETQALYQAVNYDVEVTQTPYQINNIKENPNELYIRYWLKIDDISLSGEKEWRAIWEYKTTDYASFENGFRMIALIETDSNGTPFWVFQGDTNPKNAIWRIENYEQPIPKMEWFQVEYHFKWDDGANGYASMKVNGQVIGEHYGPTTNNADNLDFIILTQVYGNSHPMYQWIDDIEIWNGVPN